MLSKSLQFILLAFFFLGSAWMYGQKPGIPYQAYFTDKNSGHVPGGQIDIPLSYADIKLRFHILDDTQAVLYTEDITAKTDEFGLFSTVIGVGNGTVVFGDFGNIVWNGSDKSLEIFIDFSNTGNGFEKHGVMELIYVPGPSLVKPMGLSSAVGQPTASYPLNPKAGDVYVDEETGDIYTYDGIAWAQAGGSIKGIGDPNRGGIQNPSPGDIYVDQATGHIYTYNSTSKAWENLSLVVSTTAGNLIHHGDDNLAHLSSADIGLFQGAGAPAMQIANPNAGDLYVNHNTGNLYVYDGTNWLQNVDETLTSLSVVTNDNGTPADTSDDFDELIYEDEAGTKNVVELNTLFDVANGLTLSATGTVELGGSLDKPTTIATSAANTLALDGLVEEKAFDNNVDQVVILDTATNVLRRTKSRSIVTQNQSVMTAADGDTDFITPLPITDTDKIEVYRNGIRIAFTKIDDNTIKLETPAVCYAGDQIRIVQLN